MIKKMFLVTLCICTSVDLYSWSVSEATAHKIAEKIWKNECAGTIEGLTCWNKGENFASLGIGHFLWYPAGKKERFQESFPELLKFIDKNGVMLPVFLKTTQECPWRTREEFYEHINSPDMIALRNFLFNTKDLQAIFIAQRLEKALPGMTKELPKDQREHVIKTFADLESSPQGLYALIDYMNFKGSGLSYSESYKGQGWGLLQVLLGMPPNSQHFVEDFVISAKEVLKKRVENAPIERNEQRWLKGWCNRLDTYLE
jgi:hypothetical protein